VFQLIVGLAAVLVIFDYANRWFKARSRASAAAAKRREEVRKWEAAERAEEREIRDLVALRKFAETAGLPRECVPIEIDGYHVSSMSVHVRKYDEKDIAIAMDPVVEVRRYYSSHNLLDDDNTVAGAFDPRRTRSEEYSLHDLPDGDLLAVYVAVSDDISVAVSVGTVTFQEYELEQSRAVAAEIRRRGLM
jgi:hypothetical protein